MVGTALKRHLSVGTGLGNRQCPLRESEGLALGSLPAGVLPAGRLQSSRGLRVCGKRASEVRRHLCSVSSPLMTGRGSQKAEEVREGSCGVYAEDAELEPVPQRKVARGRRKNRAADLAQTSALERPWA